MAQLPVEEIINESKSTFKNVVSMLLSISRSAEVDEYKKSFKYVNEVFDILVTQDGTKLEGLRKQVLTLRDEVEEFHKTMSLYEGRPGGLYRLFTSNRLGFLVDGRNNRLLLAAQSLAHLLPPLPSLQHSSSFSTYFPPPAIILPFDALVSSIVTQSQLELGSFELLSLKYILDNAGTGYVTIYKFALVLKGFGPLPKCINNIRDLFSCIWFHGFLSSGESHRLLEGRDPGMYLVRFSKSRCSQFAFAFIDTTYVTKHGLIVARAGEYSVDNSNWFPSIAQLLSCYSSDLKFPLLSTYSNLSVFYGDLTAEETDDILKRRSKGEFLIRFDNDPNTLICSYINEKNTVSHAQVISQTLQGFRWVDDPSGIWHPTIQALVADYGNGTLSSSVKHLTLPDISELQPSAMFRRMPSVEISKLGYTTEEEAHKPRNNTQPATNFIPPHLRDKATERRDTPLKNAQYMKNNYQIRESDTETEEQHPLFTTTSSSSSVASLIQRPQVSFQIDEFPPSSSQVHTSVSFQLAEQSASPIQSVPSLPLSQSPLSDILEHKPYPLSGRAKPAAGENYVVIDEYTRSRHSANSSTQPSSNKLDAPSSNPEPTSYAAKGLSTSRFEQDDEDFERPPRQYYTFMPEYAAITKPADAPTSSPIEARKSPADAQPSTPSNTGKVPRPPTTTPTSPNSFYPASPSLTHYTFGKPRPLTAKGLSSPTSVLSSHRTRREPENNEKQ